MPENRLTEISVGLQVVDEEKDENSIKTMFAGYVI